MNDKARALFEACDPFARVANVIDALPPSHRVSSDAPLFDALPRVWPTVGDVRKLRDAMTDLGWRG